MIFVVTVAVQSKECIYGRLILGIAGSNPAEGIDVRHLCFFACV
jgi:hypothetical protein